MPGPQLAERGAQMQNKKALRHALRAAVVSLFAAMLVVASSPAQGQTTGVPDLVITGITTVPALPAPNESVEVTVTVQNIGDTCAGCNTFWFHFYKNQTTPPVPGQIGTFGCQAVPLAGGAFMTCTGTVTYSGSRTYQMWAQADTFSHIAEADETNNIYGPQDLHVAPHPELAVTSVSISPASPQAGQSVAVSVVVTNWGSDCALCSPFFVDFYKALIAAPGPAQAGDIECSFTVPAQATTVTCSGNVVYPLAGSFQMWAQVDRTNTVTEFDDTNNVFGPRSVTVFSDVDEDGVQDGSDNCPRAANPDQSDMDGDGFGDVCDACPSTANPVSCPDDDNDGFTDDAEAGTPLCDGLNSDVFDDAVADDGCIGGPPQAGAFSEAQFNIGTSALDPCGNNGWPAELAGDDNRIKLQDITSFAVPAPKKLNTSPGVAGFDPRWDLVPGQRAGQYWISLQDLTTLTAGPTSVPPMFGGAKALNGPTCPLPP